jgi:undecaprenyl pyrophosphate phosphatase UppP
MTSTAASAETIRVLEDRFRAQGILRPLRVRRYESGQVLEYDVLGVWPARPAHARLEVERHVGGGYAGQVYRVRVLDIVSPDEPVEGLEAGRAYALKILVPVSGFGRFIRNLLYGIGFQAPFAPQVNPDASRAGALWQKLIRRGAAGRFGSERTVVDVLATLVDPVLGSCGELSEWVDGRLWRYEIDDNLFARLNWKPGRPAEGLGSPEYRSKRAFMKDLVGLMHEMGAPELARQYEWWTMKSQPNALKRLGSDAAPAEGLVAVDFRAGMALLPFLPQCPADFKLIVKGVARGSLVQFDRGDIARLEAYVAARPEAFAGMAGALEELKRADQAYRDALPDITHHHVRLITRPRLWTAIHRAWVRSWTIRHMADEKTAGALAKSRLASILFILLGLLPILTPVLIALRFPGRSVGLWLLWLVPLLGPFVRKLWGRADIRRHAAALLTKAGYLGRAFRAHVAEALVGWVRTGRVSEARAAAIAGRPWLYLLNRPLAFLPAGFHRFLTDKAAFKERLYLMFVKPVQLYFKPAVREKWLRDMVEEGRKNRMLSEEDAARILSQIDEPFIQKYLKSLAVHMATLFVSETVFLTIAVIYVLGHPEFGWAEGTARAALMVGAFNLLPVSPGSLVRGFYTLGVCIKERNFKDYKLALPVGFFKIIGYLAFPLQMAYRFPELARFMAGHWATEAVHVVPVFGERGAWLEHAVFDAFYNYPLSLGIRIRKRDDLAATKRPRWWAIPAAAIVAAVFTGLVDLLFVRSAGRAPELKDVWWAVFIAPIVAGFLASLWSRRAKMGKRVLAGITAGAVVGLAYGLVNTYLAPLFPGFVASSAAAAGSLWMPILWKTFIFALLGIPGTFLAETRRP